MSRVKKIYNRGTSAKEARWCEVVQILRKKTFYGATTSIDYK